VYLKQQIECDRRREVKRREEETYCDPIIDNHHFAENSE